MDKFNELVLITASFVNEEYLPSLRGVAVDWQEDTIMIYFYNDGPISEELENDFRCLGTEVVSQYSDANIHEHIERIDGTAPLPTHRYWAYVNPHTVHTALLPNVSKENIDLVQQTRHLIGKEDFFSLRGLAVEWEGKVIRLYIYHDGLLSEEMQNQYKRLAEGLSNKYRTFYLGQDTVQNAVVNKKIVRIDAPAPLPFQQFWVYQHRNAVPDFP